MATQHHYCMAALDAFKRLVARETYQGKWIEANCWAELAKEELFKPSSKFIKSKSQNRTTFTGKDLNMAILQDDVVFRRVNLTVLDVPNHLGVYSHVRNHRTFYFVTRPGTCPSETNQPWHSDCHRCTTIKEVLAPRPKKRKKPTKIQRTQASHDEAAASSTPRSEEEKVARRLGIKRTHSGRVLVTPSDEQQVSTRPSSRPLNPSAKKVAKKIPSDQEEPQDRRQHDGILLEKVTPSPPKSNEKKDATRIPPDQASLSQDQKIRKGDDAILRATYFDSYDAKKLFQHPSEMDKVNGDHVIKTIKDRMKKLTQTSHDTWRRLVEDGDPDNKLSAERIYVLQDKARCCRVALDLFLKDREHPSPGQKLKRWSECCHESVILFQSFFGYRPINGSGIQQFHKRLKDNNEFFY